MEKETQHLNYEHRTPGRPFIAPFEGGATIVMFCLGPLAWAAPAHLMGRMANSSPESAWPWLGNGLANMMLAVSLPATVVIGFVFGMLVPRFWFVALLATWWVIPLDIAIDLMRFPTSHNLFPFELVIFGLLSLPAFFASLVGMILGRGVFKGKADF